MNYLLDTDICIYILNNKHPKLEAQFRAHLHGKIVISTLTEAELYYGALHSSQPAKNRERVDAFVAPLERITFDSDAAFVFAEIKQALIVKGKPIGAIDMLIGATAKSKNFTIVTNNTKHFSVIPGLKIENWLNV